jgi:hypothetical protein
MIKGSNNSFKITKNKVPNRLKINANTPNNKTKSSANGVKAKTMMTNNSFKPIISNSIAIKISMIVLKYVYI